VRAVLSAGLAGAFCLATMLPTTATAAGLTAADCAADRDAYLAQAADNRAKRITELTAAADASADERLRQQLTDEQERAWMVEEERRGQASMIYRECMAHVERVRDGG
jgi:hypothetical protein